MLSVPLPLRHRKGFSLVELILVIAILGLLGGLSIPMYHEYQIRSDLDLADDTVRQALHRAQVLSQIGQNAAEWGFNATQGVVFQGSSYATRVTTSDEAFALPLGIVVTGLLETVYSPLYGVPSPTGDIILTAINGDRSIVSVTVYEVLGPPGIPPVQFKVIYDRIQNQGGGGFLPKVSVGTGAVEYDEGLWIPLTDGTTIVDASQVLDTPGLTVQRQSGYFRIMNYGGMSPGGKELVDARITIDRGTITSVVNDTGSYDTENPFDGNVNNGVGGDEVTVALDNKSVLFQTRSTNDGDSILIYWAQSGS